MNLAWNLRIKTTTQLCYHIAFQPEKGTRLVQETTEIASASGFHGGDPES